jgi:hypothetical protein
VISYVVREVAGWALVLLGVFIFWQTIQMLNPPRVPATDASANGDRGALVQEFPPRVFEAPAIAFIGFIVFRGGIHLLKVAVAARTSLQARRELVEAGRKTRLPQPRAALRK